MTARRDHDGRKRTIAMLLLALAAAATGEIATPFAAATDAALPSANSARERAIAIREAAAAGLGRTEANWLVAVGVNRFQDKTVSPLHCSVADAQAIHEFFTAMGFVPLGQSYLLRTEAPSPDRRPLRNNILRTVQYVADQAGPDSTILLSFSGHGFVDKDGQSYLFPEDGELPLLRDTAVSIARINEILRGSQSKRKIVFVDACRNAPRTDTRGQETVRTETFLEALKAGEGQITMASCGRGQVSFEMAEGGHGVFTHFLLEGLRGAAEADSRGIITLSSLQAYVARAVPDWCRRTLRPVQQPWMWGEMSVPIPLAVKGLAPPSRSARPGAAVPVESKPSGQNYSDDIGGLKLEMIWLPGGTFSMGSDAGDEDARPAHEVSVGGLWMSRTEVTQTQWQALMGGNPSSQPGANLPVDRVTWDEAQQFCEKLSQASRRRYALPTEAQWEYACRGGKSGRFFFDGGLDTLRRYAWHKSNSQMRLHEIGSLSANPYGLSDMLGNVWEWCADWYQPYPGGRATRFMGQRLRVLRGGAYFSHSSALSVFGRSGGDPQAAERGVGFRVVCNP